MPWGNRFIPAKLRTLGAGEFPGAGLIDLSKKAQADYTFDNKARLLNLQLEYCKKSLLCPTYEELEEMILEEIPAVREGREALERLKAELEKKQSNELVLKVKEMSLVYDCLFPPNFLAAVSSWCECLDVTHIKDLTSEKLLEAHAMSLVNKNRASDNLQGVFLERARNEIDILAHRVFNERKRK